MSAAATRPALEVRGLVKRYRRGLLRRVEARPAVDGADLHVLPGEVVGLVGESGSGKTTLVTAALGLISRDKGSATVLGEDLATLSAGRARALRRRAQMLFQRPDASLNPALRVRQILTESAALHRPDEAAGPLVDALLARLGLSHRADALPSELSGGEKRRVSLGQILLARPELVVADEPTAGLDAAIKADLLDLMRQGQAEGAAWLIISHDLPAVRAVCDRLVVMLSGRVIEELPTDKLGDEYPHHPYLRALLGASGLGPGAPLIDADPDGAGAAGCGLNGACSLQHPRCATDRPLLRDIGPGHRVACHALEAT